MMFPTGEREVQLRLWPGVALVTFEWLLWLVVPVALPDFWIFGMLGGLACGLAVVIWWMFLSRAPRLERWGAVPLMILSLAAVRLAVLHPSLAKGMMGMLIVMYGIPVLTLALVVWAAATRRMPDRPRRAALVATALIASGGFALLRTDGITGDGKSLFAWRWSRTAEQRLVASQPMPPAPAPAAAAKEPTVEPAKPAPVAAAPKPEPPKPAEWPGFRGPRRDSVVSGLRINTDWSSAKPAELWRRPVGPGWSSFAVGDGLLYTQEQRGDFEHVSCYRLDTGEPVWSHRDAARFWESNGGPGPRATPTLHAGRVYTLGATGILNALDAKTGALVWTRNAQSDTGAKLPGWGFAGSPLVVSDVLVVAVSGVLAGYDPATGKSRWFAPKAGGSYGSPHLVTLDGLEQVVLLSSTGATAVSPRDGVVLWKHAWEGFPMLQPAPSVEGGLLLTTGDSGGGLGTRRLKVTRGTNGWTAEEVWTSRGLKPYFNDLVVHDGHAYGFDGSILSCIDLNDGARKWKGGRYGHGQMLLLREQDLLLVLSEEGEVALVRAAPAEFTEIARFKALEGKTWNHPVLVRDVLIVRNGEEMAAFRLPAVLTSKL